MAGDEETTYTLREYRLLQVIPTREYLADEHPEGGLSLGTMQLDAIALAVETRRTYLRRDGLHLPDRDFRVRVIVKRDDYDRIRPEWRSPTDGAPRR